MLKRLTAILLSIVLFISFSSQVFAHNKEKHDSIIESIIFGPYKSQITCDSKNLEALENAIAICLDQFNGNYAPNLDFLKSMHIHGLPNSINEIDFDYNSHHRRFSHRGWNFNYIDDRGNWGTRKTILLQTVNHVFQFQHFAGSWWPIDWGYTNQCDAFAAFLYYLHVIADIPASGMNEGYSDMIHLALANPSEDSPDIYYELLRILPLIFETQQKDKAYTGLITDIKQQANDVRAYIRNNPDLKSNYEPYQKYASELIEKLGDKIPSLLHNEPFFKKIFYS